MLKIQWFEIFIYYIYNKGYVKYLALRKVNHLLIYAVGDLLQLPPIKALQIFELARFYRQPLYMAITPFNIFFLTNFIYSILLTFINQFPSIFIELSVGMHHPKFKVLHY